MRTPRAFDLSSADLPCALTFGALRHGSDQMKCGNDADGGGNQQRGCGRQFNWSQARRYQADLRAAADDSTTGTEGAAGRERRLQRDASEVHYLTHGAMHVALPLPCDACGVDLVGPRWQCIHCQGSVDLCITCLGRVAQVACRL